MRFARSEADGPEAGGEIGRVERALERFRQHALVDHVLNGKEAGDVGLRFLERAVGFLQLFAHGRFAAVDRHVVRAEAVHQLVHHGVGEEGVEGQILLIVRRKDDLRDRDQRLGELRVLHVLEHDALRAFFARHPFVVRQVEGGGLDAVVGVAGAEDFVRPPRSEKGRRASGCDISGRSGDGSRCPGAGRKISAASRFPLRPGR